MSVLLWLESTGVGTFVREHPSLLAYPTFTVLHTIGLAIVVGLSTVVAARTVGFAPSIPLAPLNKLFPIIWFGFGINLISGGGLAAAGRDNHHPESDVPDKDHVRYCRRCGHEKAAGTGVPGPRSRQQTVGGQGQGSGCLASGSMAVRHDFRTFNWVYRRYHGADVWIVGAGCLFPLVMIGGNSAPREVDGLGMSLHLTGGCRPNWLLSGFAAALGLVAIAISAEAHHSGSIYDRDNHITLEGIVTEYVFTSPHVQIHFRTKNRDGQSENWIALSAPPQRLYRRGWNGKSLDVGDEITVTGAPRKDGTNVLNIRRLVGPTGQVLNEGAD